MINLTNTIIPIIIVVSNAKNTLKMRFSLIKLRGHGAHLFFQPILAVLYIALVLFIFSLIDDNVSILWAVGIGSLSSSCYIIFVTPQSSVATSRRIIGGYVVGIAIGLLIRLILTKLYVLTFHETDYHTTHLFWVSAAITVGLSMLAMIVLSVEHPPAVGMSLVLVLNLQDYVTLLSIFVAALLLALIHWLLKDWLIDLI